MFTMQLNRTILSALRTTADNEKRWDEHLETIQFAINNIENKTIGKTPSQLLFGYNPRGADVLLKDDVVVVPKVIDNPLEERASAADGIMKSQFKQKQQLRQNLAAGTSRKKLTSYSGPMIV